MAEPGMEKSQKARLWVRILLAVSLALNLLFVGLTVGAAARFWKPDGHRPHPSVGAALIRALPSEHRKGLRDEIRVHRDEGRYEKGRREAEEIAEILTDVPFDPDALAEIAGRQLERHHGWLSAMQGAWLDRVSAMSVDERSEYATRLQSIMSQERPKREWYKSKN